jgi:hypothetical protein
MAPGLAEIETELLKLPRAVGVATMVRVQLVLAAKVPVHPVAARPAPGITLRVPEAAVPVFDTVTDTVPLLPRSTEPKVVVEGVTFRAAPVVPPLPPTSPPASLWEVVSLPPQPTTVSMPMSPRQLAWSNRPKFLEHVM